MAELTVEDSDGARMHSNATNQIASKCGGPHSQRIHSTSRSSAVALSTRNHVEDEETHKAPSLLPDLHYFSRAHLRKIVARADSVVRDFLATTTSDNGSFKVKASSGAKPGIPEAALKKIGCNVYAFRRAKNPAPFLGYIKNCFDKESPLQFRVGFGPLKNINVSGSCQDPDLAEYLTVAHLARVMKSLAEIYPFGINAVLVPDDIRTQTANNCPSAYTQRYINGLKGLVQDLSFDGWLSVEQGQAALYERYKIQDYLHQAEKELSSWKEENPDQFKLAVRNAERNMEPSLAANPAEAEQAAWRYLLAKRAEALSGMWDPVDAFPLRYGRQITDGYQMYTFGRETKLPWQISLPISLLNEGSSEKSDA